MLELKDTVKLFYGKYLYKVDLNLPHGHYFRNKNLDYARKALDHMQDQAVEHGKITEPFVYSSLSRSIEINSFNNLKKLYSILKNSKNYTIRIEGTIVSIYSNNYNLINELLGTFPKRALNVYKPKDESHKRLLLSDENVLFIKNESKWNYKLTLRIDDVRKYEEFIHYCEGKDFCSVPGAVSTFSWHRSSQRTLYIKDKKSLNLLYLFDGFGVQSIHRLICKKDG